MESSGRLDRLEWAHECTHELRNSKHPRWQAVRGRLEEEGVRPDDAALADYGPDGGHLASGLIATRGGRVFLVTLVLVGEGAPEDEPWVFDWEERDPAELVGIYADGEGLARELLETGDTKS